MFSTELVECSQANLCRNSLTKSSRAQQKCGVCRLAPGNEGFEQQFWSGIQGAKHPQLEAEKREAKALVNITRHLIRKSKSKPRQNLLKKAVKAEKTTERNIIQSTENSGRLHRDGDHILQGFISLDTKMQSNRIHPVVQLEELNKIALDSKRAGNTLGGLVIRNKFDVGVVVMREEDFAILVAAIKRKDDVNAKD